MDMSKMLKDLQKMQNKMLKAQSDLKAQSFEAEAGGGMVKVAMNGKGVITMIKINPDAVDKDDHGPHAYRRRSQQGSQQAA